MPLTSLLIANRKSVEPPSRSTLETVLDYIDRPGQAVRGAIKGGYDPNESVLGGAWKGLSGQQKVYGTDLLGDAGMDAGWTRSGLGFLTDIATDPLTFLPAGAIGKVAKVTGATALGKAAGRGVVGAGKLGLRAAEKVAPHLPGGELALAGAKQLPESIAKTFIPGYGLDEGYREARRLHDAFQRTNAQDVAEKIVEVSKGYDPTVRRGALIWLEKGAEKLKDPNYTPLPEVVELAEKYKALLTDIFQREASVGLQDAAKQIENYAPRVFGKKLKEGKLFEGWGRTISAKNPFANKRQLDTIDEALKANAEADAALAVNARLRAGEKSIRSAQFMQDMAAQYGKKVERVVGDDGVEMGIKKSSVPEGFRAVFTGKDNPLGDSRFFHQVVTLADGTKAKLRDIAMPERIADDLHKTFLKQGKAKGAGMQVASDVLGGLNKAFRAGATYLRPGFHLTNLQGNLWNMNLAGMDPVTGIIGTAKQAKGLWKGASELPERVGNYTREQIAEAIKKFNISSPQSTFAGMEHEANMGEKIIKALDGRSTRGLGGKYADLMRKLGTSVEGGSKEALFLKELKAGKSVEEAAKTVNKFLFDYADLTNAERKIRNFIPFYTWSRKNIPLQAEMLLEKPAIFAGITKTKHALESVNPKEQVPDAYRPDYLRDEQAIQLPWNKKGGATYWQHYLPFKDLNAVPLPGLNMFDTREAMQGIASMGGPIAKVPMEILANRNFLNGRPLYNEDLGYFGDFRPVKALGGLPLPVAMQHMVSSLLPVVPYAGKPMKAGIDIAAGDPGKAAAELASMLGFRATVKNAKEVKTDKTYAKSDIKTAAGRKKKRAKEFRQFGESLSQRAKRLSAEMGLD